MMKKIYFIKNEDDFKSLMVDLEKEGARWRSGIKPTERVYSEIYGVNLITVENYFINYYSSITGFSNALEEYGVEKEIHIIPYTAKRENIGYSFKEILDMEWKTNWRVDFYHRDFGMQYSGHLDGLMEDLCYFRAETVHKILSEARFYIDKGER